MWICLFPARLTKQVLDEHLFLQRRFLLSAHSIYANSPATMVAVTKGGIARETEILCGTELAGMAAYH